MKNTKKIISLVLAICMLASLAISASAANTVTLLAAPALLPLLCPALLTAASAATPQLRRCP